MYIYLFGFLFKGCYIMFSAKNLWTLAKMELFFFQVTYTGLGFIIHEVTES